MCHFIEFPQSEATAAYCHEPETDRRILTLGAS